MYQDDRVNAGGGHEAVVSAITRYGWGECSECDKLSWGKVSSKA